MAQSIVAPVLATTPVSKPEPRGMTIAELLLFVAGFAIAFRLETFWGVMSVLPAAILWRQFAYRRAAHPAEWLAILLMTYFLAQQTLDLDRSADWFFKRIGTSPSVTAGRLQFAAIVSGALMVALGTVWFSRRWLSSWVITILVAAAATVWFRWPTVAFALALPWLLPQPSAPASDLPGWLNVELRMHLSHVPALLVFAIPAVAALFWWRKRTWIWTEWASVFVAILAATLMLVMLYVLRQESPSTGASLPNGL